MAPALPRQRGHSHASAPRGARQQPKQKQARGTGLLLNNALRSAPVAVMRPHVAMMAVRRDAGGANGDDARAGDGGSRVMTIAVTMVAILHFAHVRHDVALLHAAGDAAAATGAGLRAITGAAISSRPAMAARPESFKKFMMSFLVGVRFIECCGVVSPRSAERPAPLVIMLRRVT